MSEWNRVPLESLLKSGVSYGIVQPGSAEATGVPIVRVKDVRNGRIDTSDPLRVSPDVEVKYSRTRLQGGEVLLTLVGSTGQVAIASDRLAGWNVARAIGVLRPIPDISPRWLQYFIESEDAQQYIRERLNTTVQATLNLKDVRVLPVPLPSRQEREGIISVIGSLDDKIAVNEHIAATADTLVSAHYQSEQAGLPAESEHLGRLAHVVVGGTPSRSIPEYWSGGTINWINSGKANEFRVLEPSEMITEDGLSASSVKLMPPGATLIGITGATMGQVSRLEIVAGGSQNVAGVWSDDPALTDWLFYDIKARVADLTKHASGGAQQHINKRIIVELECGVPTSARLAAWSAKTSPLLRIAAHALVETRTLATLRDTLLPQLMSGRLHVKDAEKIVEDHT
ncbi:type I restriction enzyme S subunit [Streptomyces phaeochromogenes]|uniref:restriction endonuclease subunit S n=1 Tax=Streptomyces phaeochromogenes TaxID=1923 RepID=UPI002791015C|nr:restriction endonuclease subunit S [Streptomyces phaeochromogenes]MDQ0951479.1 type I restriction enzyme S subunit [Streptomyces phaeochromogenes]